MRVTVPIEITTAKLTTTNVTDNVWYDDYGNAFTYSAWSSATGYVITNRVIYQNRAYEAKASSTNKIPSQNPDLWIDLGATNRFSMFDLTSNTQTLRADNINVTLTLGERINTVGLLNVDADSLTITMTNASVIVYSITETLGVRNNTVSDWYEYFYTPFTNKQETAYFDLPPYAGATINIVITKTGLTAKCGSVVFGTNEYLGQVEDGANTDSLNFSVNETDSFGNTTLIPRPSKDQIECELLSSELNAQRLKELRRMLNAKPAMWSGLDDKDDPYFGNLLTLGFYENFRTRLNKPFVFTSLKIREI